MLLFLKNLLRVTHLPSGPGCASSVGTRLPTRSKCCWSTSSAGPSLSTSGSSRRSPGPPRNLNTSAQTHTWTHPTHADTHTDCATRDSSPLPGWVSVGGAVWPGPCHWNFPLPLAPCSRQISTITKGGTSRAESQKLLYGRTREPSLPLNESHLSCWRLRADGRCDGLVGRGSIAGYIFFFSSQRPSLVISFYSSSSFVAPPRFFLFSFFFIIVRPILLDNWITG